MRRRDFGSVRKLPSGRWQGRYRDRAGQLITAPGTFKTKGDATAWLSSVQTDQGRGQFIDPRLGRVSLREFADQFIAERRLTDRSRETYQGLLRCHILPKLGDTEIGQLSPSTIRTWHARLAAEHPSTAAKAYRLLRTILNTAVADDLIIRNPCRLAGAGQERSAERPIATLEEVDALVDAMPARLQTLILLAVWGQLRKGELCALRRCDIDLQRSTVSVRRNLQQLANGELVFKEPKTVAGRRTIVLPPHVVAEVSSHLAQYTAPGPEALVFTGDLGGPVRPHVLQKYWDRARLAAGRPDLHLHDLRHTGNTWAAATGASTRELMARMGHASPDAALRYQHATESRDRAIAEALSAMVNPKTS